MIVGHPLHEKIDGLSVPKRHRDWMASLVELGQRFAVDSQAVSYGDSAWTPVPWTGVNSDVSCDSSDTGDCSGGGASCDNGGGGCD
jgi:hypothetical protein